jgi:A/G-specific adenine glycosylase
LTKSSFAERLVAWQRQHGRHDLPWQRDVTSYRVWISEIMLQQTQVSAVIPYFERFMQRFATLADLAVAPIDDVLYLWSGLGYYSRARNLHKAANIAVALHDGELPLDIDALIALPGIGRSTAGAILALSDDQPTPILDGNAKRVLCRHVAVSGWPGSSANTRKLWTLASERTPLENAGIYTQAIMDLGATLCTRSRPRCLLCPVQTDCKARIDGLTDTIPAAKPKRERPLRETRFVIARRPSGELLIERRPPTGIWGGLWCFPELDLSASLDDWSIAQFGTKPSAHHDLTQMRHGFTHFELLITPCILDINLNATAVADSDALDWCHAEAPPSVGFAAPMKRLLETLVTKRHH